MAFHLNLQDLKWAVSPVSFLLAPDFLIECHSCLEDLRDCHWTKPCVAVAVAGLVFWSQRPFLGYALCFFDLLLFLFSDSCSYALCGIWFRFGMAHFSAFGDSTASLFICARIRFELCDNHYLAAFVLPDPANCFCGKICCVYYHSYLSFDPFFSIVASLKAMQCVKLMVYALFSYGCQLLLSLRSALCVVGAQYFPPVFW